MTITGEGCTLGKKNVVSGSVAAEVSSEELTSQPLTFSKTFSSAVNKGREEEKLEPLKLTASGWASPPSKGR